MKKGSPRDYDAETGCFEQLAQKSQLGESHECYPPYDTLKPYAEKLVMVHPARMKAITAGKKKSDTIDARTIADLLRCDLLATCYVLAPEMRDLRRLLCYRNLVVHQLGRMQNRSLLRE